MKAAKLKIIEQPYREMQDYLATTHIGRQADGGMDALYDRIAAEGDGRIKPIRVPWWLTNQALGYGLTPGQVTIVAGSAGVAKSYLLLNLLRYAGEKGVRWRLLPLEDDAGRWIQRMLAVHLTSWAMVAQPEDEREETRRRVADRKLAALDENKLLIAQWYESIFENPRLPVDDGSGALVARDVHYRDVLAFLEGIADACDLVGLDCLSQISFSEDGRDYVGQSEFMRGVVGIAASTGAHIVLVGHNGKGGANRDPLDGIQGSALFNRLAHNVMVLTRNDPPLESEVLSRMNPTVEHKLTLSIAERAAPAHMLRKLARFIIGEGRRRRLEAAFAAAYSHLQNDEPPGDVFGGLLRRAGRMAGGWYTTPVGTDEQITAAALDAFDRFHGGENPADIIAKYRVTGQASRCN